MANKFFGAIDLTGNSDGDLDQINDSVLSDGDGGYVITDAERIYIYHYDSGDTGNEDSPRLIKPDTVGDGNAGSWMIAEIVAQNFVMATNAQYLKAMQSDGSTEAGILRLNASDDTEIRAITGQSVDVIINATKVADFAAAGLTLAAGATINEFSIDGTMAGNSDTAVPTEKAIVTYLSTGFVTLTGVETLTNKTLTSPDINGGDLGSASITACNIVTSLTVPAATPITFTGAAQIVEDITALTIKNAAGTETMAIFIPDGEVGLYHNNNIKAQTAATGLVVTGELDTTTLDVGSTISITGVLDEDNMASNSAVKLATQQSIKAYADGVVSTHAALTATHGVAGAIVGTTDSQTLSNKTLTSPVLNTGLSGTAFLDEDTMASDSATKVASQQSIKAYVDNKVYRNSYGSAVTWNVAHNLGIQNCNVEVIVGGVSVAGTYDEPTITFTDANNLTVVFTVATAGDVVVYS